MKKIFLHFIRSLMSLALLLLITSAVYAQVPSKMSYQAVVRDAANKLVVNNTVGVQINILQGSSTGSVVYTENQKGTTNINGLVTLEIGGGAGFLSIDWTKGPFFIQTKIDPKGGTNYSIEGTSQVLSVPFAFAAGTALKLVGPIDEKDPVFTAWDKSTGIKIKENQITDLKHFTTKDETDPVFKAWNKSDGITITESQITNLKHFTNANETDPIFSAWNKSTGIVIKENQISDLKHFTTADEKDPVFKAWDKSTGITIKESQITDLDHFTTADEKDPVFGASLAKKITAKDTTRWAEDSDPENELQYLYKQQHKIMLTQGGWIVTDLQDAYYNGDSITTSHGPVVINAATGGALKLMDGTQAVNRVWVSDASGLGHWQLIMDANVADNAEIQVSKLHEGAQGSILGSYGSNPVWTAPQGDVLIEWATGLGAVTAIQRDSVSTREIRDTTIRNIDVAPHAGIEVTKLENGPNANIIVGNANGLIHSDWVPMSGSVLMNNAGVTTLIECSVSSREICDESIVAIDIATGAVETDEILNETILEEDIADEAVTSVKIANGTIVDEDVSDIADIQISKLLGTANGDMIVSVGDVPTWVSMSGDVEIDETGLTTIQPDAVGNLEMEDNAIGNDEMLDNAIGLAEMQDDAVGSAEIINDEIIDEDINADAEIQISKLLGTVNGDMIVSVGDVPTWVSMSGDVEIDETGLTTIQPDAVGNLEMEDNAIGNDEMLDNAIGLAEMQDDAVGSAEIINDEIIDEDINADAEIQISKLLGTVDGDMIVSVGDVPTWVSMSGDVEIDETGLTTIQPDAVGSLEINDDEIMNADVNTAAGIEVSKLEAGGVAQIIVGLANGTPVNDWVSMSGSVFMNNFGVTTIWEGVVSSREIADESIEAIDINTDAVDTDEIAADAVTASEIATDAVDSDEIAADAVGSDEIAADAVTASEIATDAVGADEIIDGSVGTAEIENLSIVNGDISATAAIEATKLENGPNANIIVGNANSLGASDWVLMSGDVTMDNTGLTTITAGAVDLTNDVSGILPAANGGTGINNGANTLTVGASASVSGANTGDVTLAGEDYLSIAGQVITAADVDLTDNVTGALPIANGGTNAITAAAARTNLGLQIGVNVQAYNANTTILGGVINLDGAEVTGTLPVGLGGTGLTAPGVAGNVLTSDGTVWTSATLPEADPVYGAAPAASITAGDMTDIGNLSGTNSGDVTLAGETYLSIAGQVVTAADVDLTTNVTGALPIANGGTGAATAAAARTALGLQIGLNVQGYNVNTTVLGGVINLDTEVTATLPIANGGTGQTTQQAAVNALAGAVTSGQYLRGNGTNVTMSAIQAVDVPTLNQNTTGNAATATIASGLLYGADTGASDAYVVDVPGTLTAYTTGLTIIFKPTFTNSGGAATINVDGLGAQSIAISFGANPAAGDIPAAGAVMLVYDGTNFLIVGK